MIGFFIKERGWDERFYVSPDDRFENYLISCETEEEADEILDKLKNGLLKKPSMNNPNWKEIGRSPIKEIPIFTWIK